MLEEAEEKLNQSDVNEACELYNQAGSHFEIAKDWSAAGNAFLKSAELHATQADSKHEASLDYDKAATCFRKFDFQKAFECLERSNEINKSEVLALRAHLAGLSRHCVYGFYNKDKQLMYVGQTTDFNQRASKHLGIALENRDQSDSYLFHKSLTVELKRGIYVMPLFEHLDELQANDRENALIIALRDREIGTNVSDGRWTQRFSALTDVERDLECENCYDMAMRKIQDVLDDQVVTLANYKTKFRVVDKKCGSCKKIFFEHSSKCRKCRFVKKPKAECKRDNCDKLGVGNNGYCWSCYKQNKTMIIQGKTLPPLQTKYSNKNTDFNNTLQRSLTFRMEKLGGTAIKTKVDVMFPNIKMICRQNINLWIRDKIKPIKSADDLAKFLRANQPSYFGFTSDMVNHLLVYEHSITKDVKKASKRLNELFCCEQDKGKFSWEIVQDKFANIEFIKKSLKRKAVDEDKPDVESKKAKNEK